MNECLGTTAVQNPEDRLLGVRGREFVKASIMKQTAISTKYILTKYYISDNKVSTKSRSSEITCGTNKGTSFNRIVGGEDADKGKFKFIKIFTLFCNIFSYVQNFRRISMGSLYTNKKERKIYT